ncbi:SDR family NAD(P)-dependent oxidoreductase [Streptomyces sp. NBC_00190]|uniref:type I polyketide synthase n=1 Tax=Streptomyces sp. NBC_00190 TaxID=2903634 RepID=UPI002E2C5665|nr:SDR family NAD(P)-dependent oxidoreductase [Streptomyces sp. NBC_00190]
MDTADDFRNWLTERIGERLGVSAHAVDVDTQFRDLGIDSVGMTALTAELATRLGRPLSPTVAWHFPTVSRLAANLAAAPAPDRGAARGETRGTAMHDEPIAVIGLACRFPGAPNAEEYWNLLRSGADAVTGIPADRWDGDALYDPDPSTPGRMSTRRGGFIRDVDQFDPQFFGISPREAVQMDPQQRLALELTWSALQDSGIPPASLRDSSAGVFLGTLWSDYARLAGRDLAGIGQHSATGQEPSIIPARVSYTLGLQGPSIGVNTACSSSLVAVHLACQSLRAGESTLALAGGVNLVLAPESSTAMTKLGAMSPDGRSKAFDAAADGYVRGEGAGLVVLKPLSAALADGDRIHCVIRGSAVNNDGASNGLTAPSPSAQVNMLRTAYTRAGVDVHDVQYVEAHGTGTRLGDPIEAHALGTVLGAGRPAQSPLLIGSVKTNIGHLEAAAGIAGLIKVALAIRHRVIPPTLHHHEPNPDIPLDELRLSVPTVPTVWPAEDRALLAGVSSFGFGGTNCHVVLEGPPTRPVQILPLSAPTPEALREAAAAMADALAEAGPQSVADWCGTAALRLGGHPYRTATTVRTQGELRTALERMAGEGAPHPPADQPPRLAFVFSGQGSQWCAMGRELLHGEAVFREALLRCDHLIHERTGISVVAEICREADESRLDGTEVMQPAVFAVQVALAELWRSWGIEPDAVVGHSLGEVAAAHVAGVLRLEDAVSIVCHRSRLMSRIDGLGSVAVVDLPFAEAQELAAAHPGGISAAGSNSPGTSVLSGDVAALDACLTELGRRGVGCRRVNMSVAAHSAQCDALLPELREALTGIRPMRARVPLMSSLTGDFVTHRDLGPSYWERNLRDAVLFAPAVERLLDAGYDTFLEVSPHPVLTNSVDLTARHHGVPARSMPSLRRGADAREVMLDTLGELYRSGRDVTWRPVFPADLRLVALPQAAAGPAGDPPEDHRVRTLPLSAHSQAALRDLARSTEARLAGPEHVDLHDLCHSAARTGDRHDHRLAAVFTSREQLRHQLAGYAADRRPPGVATGRAVRRTKGPVFLFSGQGTQTARMGCELLAGEAVFRDVLERCDQWLAEHAGWSLIDELEAAEESSRINETEITQPALLAVQVGLAELWRSWGVVPATVVGHSAGEIAAAHCAGVLSLEDAMLVALHRGRVLQRATGRGRMAAVGLGAAQAAKLVAGRKGQVSVAAVNGPRTTLLSGETEALRELLDDLDPAVFRKMLRVGYPSHSPQMRVYERELGELLANVRPGPGDVPIFSTIEGALCPGTFFDASYWVRTISEPVRFSEAAEALIADGSRSFVEIGPEAVLLAPLSQHLEQNGVEGVLVPSLRRDAGERESLQESAGALYAAGHPVDWTAVQSRPGRLVATPEYPWQRERYWITPAPLAGQEPAVGRVADLLERSDVDRLIDEIAADGDLSEEETRLLPRILRRLTADRPAPGPPEDAGEWLHRTVWRDQPLRSGGRTEGPGTWIVLTDGVDDPLAWSVRNALHDAGEECALIAVGTTTDDELSAELHRAMRATAHPCRGVLRIAPATVAGNPGALTAQSLEGCLRPALTVIRQLASWQGPSAPRLWIATTGAQAVSGKPAEDAVAHSALWGFGRVAALEHPEVWGGLLDLDPDAGAPDDRAGMLVAELLDGDGEDQVAFRGGRRHVARLALADEVIKPAGEDLIRPDASYLITGGLGGLGLTVAQWLVAAGARHLVLLGRRPADADARKTLARLTAAGASVHVLQADVTEAAEVRAVLNRFGRELPGLRGVIHAAGVLDDGTLLHQDWDRFAGVLAPKVLGAHHLDVLTRELPLDFFVLFSSFVAVLGSPGQGGYAAANAALDSLAHRRRSLGLPALSVNWGPWDGVGMTAGSAAAARFRWSERGARTIGREAGTRLFDRVLACSSPQIGVFSVDWEAYRAWLPAGARRELLALVHDEAGSGTAADDRDARLSLPARLASLDPVDRLEHLVTHVGSRAAGILGFAEGRTVDPQTGFFQLGMDSLMAIRFVVRLREDFGDRLRLLSTLPIDHPTCASLAAHLLDQLGLGTPPDAADATGSEPDIDEDLMAEVERLSAADAAKYLDELMGAAEDRGEQTHE